MKSLNLALLLILTGAIFASAQTPTDPSTSPNIKILHQKWHLDVRNPTLDEDPFGANTQFQDALRVQRANEIQNAIRAKGSESREPPPIPTSKTHRDAANPSATYTYTAEIKNAGLKAIREVDWSYVFIDPVTQKEIGNHRQTSRLSIRPGQNKNLIGHSASPPTNTVSARDAGKELSKRTIEQVVIYLIEYDDGSVWRNPIE